MKKQMQLPIRIGVNQYSSQTVLEIHLEPNCLRDWCLGLALLKERLVSSILITPQRGKSALECELMDQHHGLTEVTILPKRYQVRLSPQSADYLFLFCLQYFRDGFTEVDHIDLNAVATNCDYEDFSLTFSVSAAATPVSAEDARSRLNTL